MCFAIESFNLWRAELLFVPVFLVCNKELAMKLAGKVNCP